MSFGGPGCCGKRLIFVVFRFSLFMPYICGLSDSDLFLKFFMFIVNLLLTSMSLPHGKQTGIERGLIN